ncbi:MAG: zinc-ribbon domain-containing protein [Candidatus Methanoplasma sp.]|jgi:hypothetical protein|nr:zinc-ribbon domain-containing protein [Candidatus Methanoplasma sp.]
MDEKPAVKYKAQAMSPFVKGEVDMIIAENALAVAGTFEAMEISFTEMNALKLADHVITIKADRGDLVLSKMGNWCQPFYEALCDAYNKAVLRSLFVKSSPVIIAKGNYRYTEKNTDGIGAAAINVYENSVVILPPDIGARRVPLCFVCGIEKSDLELTLKTDAGETYTYAKLGYEIGPFASAVEKQIGLLRERSMAAVMEIDPTLTVTQASQIVKLMPQGAAASFGQLAAIAPSFAEALEKKIAGSRAAESYAIFKELCDPMQIYIGFKRNEAIPKVAEGSVEEEGAEAASPDPYMLWLIAPSPDERFATVEFAEANTATFIYHTGGDFDGFAKQLNRALEAIDFKREVIRLSDEELRKPENTDYFMASKRTAALQFVRSNFAGRVIHSSAESWKRKVKELWGSSAKAAPAETAPAQPAPPQTGKNYCTKCGTTLAPDMKFCRQCGKKI